MMNRQWIFNRFLMNFRWILNEFSMDFHRISDGRGRGFHSHGTGAKFSLKRYEGEVFTQTVRGRGFHSHGTGIRQDSLGFLGRGRGQRAIKRGN